jgi:hypothetical protein
MQVLSLIRKSKAPRQALLRKVHTKNILLINGIDQTSHESGRN